LGYEERRLEGVGLIVHAISFQDFQPMLCDSDPPTSQTDRRHAIARPRFAYASRVKIKETTITIDKEAFNFLRGTIRQVYGPVLESNGLDTSAEFRFYSDIIIGCVDSVIAVNSHQSLAASIGLSGL